MKKRYIAQKAVTWLLTLILALGCCAGAIAQTDGAEKIVLDCFLEPDSKAKPMARMWFPDAAAGEDEYDYIEKQILELAEKGFGGVEVAMLSTGVAYDNDTARTYGWGTENWRSLLKKVLKAAAKVEGGFQVDMTITSQWPPTLNTIDPNDEAASQELTYSVTKLTSADIANGQVELVLPEQKQGPSLDSFGGSGAYEHFLFTDTFVSAAVA